jgi:hypothetical protein
MIERKLNIFLRLLSRFFCVSSSRRRGSRNINRELDSRLRGNDTRVIVTIIFFLFFFVTSCSSTTSTTNEAGTSIGNPVEPTPTPTASKLTFTTSSSSSSSNDASLNFAITASEDYCRESGFTNFTGAQSQHCTGTPVGYNMGILGIYLVECHDKEGNPVLCDSSDLYSVHKRIKVYDGDQVNLEIGEDDEEFSGDLEDISDDMTITGIQFVLAHFGQKTNSEDVSETEAAKVAEHMQGITYRICTSPHEEIDDEDLMEERCGNKNAELGHNLVDMDGDGDFGFFDLSSMTASSVSEASSEPTSGYDVFTDASISNQVIMFVEPDDDSGLDQSVSWTDGEFYDVEGYFAPIFSLAEITEVEEDKYYEIAVSINIDDTFEWVDGADGSSPTAATCVQAVTDVECSPDTDPGSVGVYNPYYDSLFLPASPETSVTVTEIEE